MSPSIASKARWPACPAARIASLGSAQFLQRDAHDIFAARHRRVLAHYGEGGLDQLCIGAACPESRPLGLRGFPRGRRLPTRRICSSVPRPFSGTPILNRLYWRPRTSSAVPVAADRNGRSSSLTTRSSRSRKSRRTPGYHFRSPFAFGCSVRASRSGVVIFGAAILEPIVPV